MEHKQLISFMVLADMLHFGRAAKFLNLTQPALSNQIMCLERDLGGDLFIRQNKQIHLTEAGKLLQKEGRRILDDTDSLENRLKSILKGNEGSISIGYGDVTELKRLSRAIMLLRERCPGISLRVNELSPGETIESVQAGRLDTALVTGSSKLVFDDSLEAIPVMLGPLKLAMPAGHPLTKVKDITKDLLLKEWFIRKKFGETDETSEMVRLQTQWWDNFFGEDAKVLFSVRKRSTAFWLVSAGIGMAILPNCFELISCPNPYYAQASNVEFRYLPGLEIISYTYLVYKKQHGSALDKFLECTSECFDTSN